MQQPEPPAGARSDLLPELPAWIARECPARRLLVRVAAPHGVAVDLHCFEAGPPDARPVLLLHGNRSWAVTWRRVMERLETFRCIAPDLPGFGLSGFLAGRRLSIEAYGETIAALLERLDLRDVVFVAHEAGGLVLAAAGRACEERLAGGVLVDVPALPAGDAPPPVLHRFARWPRLRDLVYVACGRPELALAALQTRRGEFQRTSRRLYGWPLASRRRRLALVELARAVSRSAGARRAAGEWLLDFPGPLALVWGHRDPLMRPQDFAVQERELPYARILRSEAGHFLQEEEPRLVVKAVEWAARNVRVAPSGLPENFLPGIGAGDFHAVGRRLVESLVELGGLRPDERILDVGCGLGRTALALREILGPAGRYEGFDVVPEVVRWCQQNISRLDRRFRFRWAPLRNPAYHPAGEGRAETYAFPYRDEAFDFVIANSVFTHLTAAEAVTYLRQIRRVLRPAGRVWLSAFLIDEEARRAIAAGRSDRSFAHPYGDGWAEHPERPLDAIAFDRQWLLDNLRKADLELSRPVIDGSWRGSAAASASYQDIIVATAVRSPSPAS